MPDAEVDHDQPDLASMLSQRRLNLRDFRLQLIEQLKTIPPLDQLQFGNSLIAQVIDLSPDTVTRTHRDAALLVLKFQKRWSEVEDLLERMPDSDDLGPAARLAVIQAREKMGRFDRALGYADASVALFPSSRALQRRRYNLLRVTGRHDDADAVFEQLRADFAADEVVAVISGLKGAALPPTEIDFLIDQLPTTDDEQLPKLTLTLANASLSNSQLARLSTMLESLDPRTNARLRIILATAEDEVALLTLNTREIPLATFEARRDLVRRLENQLGSTNVSEPQRDPGNSAAADALLTRESYFDALSVALELRRRIETGTPTLLTRVGDGEGAFMRRYRQDASPDDVSEHIARQVIWWGEQTTPERAAQMAADYERVLSTADFVGVPPPWRLRQPFRGAAGHQMRRNLDHSIELVAQHTSAGSAWITSAHMNTDLEKWNLWRLVFNATDQVNFVACHDLEAALDTNFSVGTGTKVLVPGVHRFAEVFGADLDLGGSNLLEHHERVCEIVQSRPAGVWLIAAGFLGKHYGALVRRGGGIALDIGALADYWAGYTTRDFSGDAIVHHLPTSLASGVETTWRDKPATADESETPLRSNRYFDGFSTSRASADPSSSSTTRASAPSCRFKIIGHPRCASGHVAQVFQAFGFDVGHERLRADGIASWMLAVDDTHVPWGDVPDPDQRFEHVLGYVRNPIDAIPSIVLENGAHDSFMFRRLHILRTLEVDIARYRTPLDRAAASLVYWDLIVRPQLSGPTLHVETAAAEVDSFLTSIDGGADAGKARIPATDERYNSSTYKHGVQKQPMSPAAFASLDPGLQAMVDDYCVRYGYPSIVGSDA